MSFRAGMQLSKSKIDRHQNRNRG